MLQTLFGMGGRLSRIGFWEVVISVLLLDVAAGVAGITSLEHAFPDNQFVTASTAYQLVSWGLFAVAALSIWAIIAAHVKRAHDRGHGAIFLIWLIVPVIGWFWLLYELGFQPGQNFRNRFGLPPLHHYDDEHAGGERLMQAQPVSNGHGQDHGHGGGLFHRSRPNRVVRTGPAVLDWTGAASEESAEAAAHGHDDHDAGEALMAASERWARQPAEPEHAQAPAPEYESAPPPHADHAFSPAFSEPQPAPSAQPAATPNDLSAAMGTTRH
jgi:uncharacterized membrane protein YhaH (DUF805 family)